MSEKSYAAIVAQVEGQKRIQIIISNMNPVERLVRRLLFVSSSL